MAQLIFQIIVLLVSLMTFIWSINYDVIVDRIECVYLPNGLCRNLHCNARPVKRYLTHITAGCYLPDPADNVKVRATMNYKFTEYRKFLIDMEENVCDYFSKKPTKILQIFMPQIVNSSNFKSCPFQGEILIKDLMINSDYTPPGLPAGQYRLDFLLTSNKSPLTSVKLYLTIKPRGATKLEMG